MRRVRTYHRSSGALSPALALTIGPWLLPLLKGLNEIRAGLEVFGRLPCVGALGPPAPFDEVLHLALAKAAAADGLDLVEALGQLGRLLRGLVSLFLLLLLVVLLLPLFLLFFLILLLPLLLFVPLVL